MSQSHHKTRRKRGFTLIEVMIASSILAFGLLAVAGLMSQLTITTSQSRAAGIETILASEKLEELNQYPTANAQLNAGGSLSVDTTGYSDSVQVSAGMDPTSAGDVVEITLQSGGTYSTITHSPNGAVTSVGPITGTPPVYPDMLVFDRRWLIVTNPVVNGVTINNVRQITVWVQLTNTRNPVAPFQTSLVRPW